MDAQKHNPPGSVQLTATTNSRPWRLRNDVVRVRGGAQHPIERGDRGEVATPDAEECVRRLLRLGVGSAVRGAGPHSLTGWVQELLPGLRAGRMAEARLCHRAAAAGSGPGAVSTPQP